VDVLGASFHRNGDGTSGRAATEAAWIFCQELQVEDEHRVRTAQEKVQAHLLTSKRYFYQYSSLVLEDVLPYMAEAFDSRHASRALATCMGCLGVGRFEAPQLKCRSCIT
jgi:hypothetical protein